RVAGARQGQGRADPAAGTADPGAGTARRIGCRLGQARPTVRRYQALTAAAATAPTQAPASMNGPKGIIDSRPAGRGSIRPPPTGPPSRKPRKAPTTSAPQPSQPRYIPSTPASLTSPSPMPAG